MRFTTISANGVTLLQDGNSTLRTKVNTSVYIDSNGANATVTVGYMNSADEFKAFPDGLFTDEVPGKLVWHGFGAKLAVQAAGITTGNLVIGWTD